MQYRKFGSTNLQVAPIGLGTVELGMPYEIGLPSPPSEKDSIALLRRAYEAGINYIDTAPVYGNSEELVGKAFADIADKPILATKVTLKEDQGKGAPLKGNNLRQHLETSITNSLKILHLDCLEVLQIHSVEDNFATEELLELTADFRHRGLVRHWGVTTYGETAPMEVLAWPEHFQMLQVAYNALDRRMETEVFPRCKQIGVGLVLRSAFFKGVLSDRARHLPDHLSELTQAALKVEKIATDAGLSLPELAFRFNAYNPFSNISLFGTTSALEMDANLDAFQAGPLSDDILDQLAPLVLHDSPLINPSTWGF
tara:strand:+ start:648 stop:1586 length:939 start_codon:yes stop_codon:yes gene_type:complete